MSNDKQEENFTAGDILKATIKRINICSMDLTIGNTIGHVHITEIVDSIQDGSNPLSEFRISQQIDVRCIGIKCRVVHKKNRSSRYSYLECTMKPSKFSVAENELEDNSKHIYNVGDQVIAYIRSISNRCIWFTVDSWTKGRAYMLNVSNSLGVVICPEKYFGKGCGYIARVLNIERDDLLELSLIDRVKQVEEGNCALALITDKDESEGLRLRLAEGYKGTVHLTEIADEYTENQLADFKRGFYIECYVISTVDKEMCELSLRRSRLRKNTSNVKDPQITMETISAGQVLRGFVANYMRDQLTVSLSPGLNGCVFKDHLSDFVIEDPPSVFEPGKLVTVKVLWIEPSLKLIILSMRGSETGVEEKIPEALKLTRAPLPDSASFKSKRNRKRRSKVSEKGDMPGEKSSQSKSRNSKSVDSKNISCETANVSGNEKRIVKRKSPPRSNQCDNGKKKVKEKQKMITSGSYQGESGVDRVEGSKALPILAIKSELSWEGYGDEKKEICLPTVVVKSEIAWDSEFAFRTEGAELMADVDSNTNSEKYQRHQLEGKKIHQEVDDFENLVLQSPNSSMVWLRYMSYHLEATEVDKARAVAERALTTMSSSEKQENFNVWVGYLNLENMYGTPELLKKVMDRALKENKPKKVYWHMIKVYIQSGKMEEAEQLYTTMTNKLRQKRKVWKEFGEFHYKNHRPESARKILQSSLKSLDKKYHAGTISKFAQMEFEYGEPEKGKTMFENLLRKKPKRSRVWSLYIDLVTKLGEIENARKMYERVGNLNLSAKKMRFFFKKYLDFEKGQRETESMAVVNCRL